MLSMVDNSSPVASITEVAADKGYHKASTLELAEAMDLRTYIPERKKKHKAVWTDKPDSYRKAVVANRRRVRRKKGRQLQRWRSERVERSFAHVCNTGGARRCQLRGVEKISKRYLIVTAARNLGLIMLKLFGIGKPRKLQKGEDDSIRVLALIWTHWRLLNDHVVTFGRRIAQFLPAAASPPPARPAFAFAA